MIALLLPLLLQLPAPAPMRNVLVIVGDDIGWTERSRLTALDVLAANGVTFNRAYSWPVCSPTRHAALYGRYPRRAGIGDVISAHCDDSCLSPAPDRLNVSLAEALKPTHRTALFGKWHLGRAAVANGVDLLAVTESGPFVSGFDVWRAGNPNSIAQGPGSDGYWDWYRVDDEQVFESHTTYATDAQLGAWRDWWKNTAPRRFAWLGFSAAHAPYDAPPGSTFFSYPPTRNKYLAVVDYLDGAISSLLSDVDLTDTYVVYFSDNGTPNDVAPSGLPGNHWKGTTFEGGVRVPLIIAGPGISEGAVSNRLVSLADLPATLLELTGVESRGFEDSRSFADELGNWPGEPARSWVFTERYGVSSSGNPYPSAGYDDQAIIEQDWKLRVWDVDGPGLAMPKEAIYYLVTDPNEVSPIDPDVLPVESARLHAALASVAPRL